MKSKRFQMKKAFFLIICFLFLKISNVIGSFNAALVETTLNVNDAESDSLALISLYNSTDGANWRNTWDLSKDMSTWYGVTLTSDRVTELNLYYNSLNGSIPIELGSLSNLTHLSLSDNSLSGSIPVELGNLSNLTYLSLYYNSLSGSIPVELGNLRNLAKLYLHSNSLSGSIPVELGNLSNLIELHLGGNSLSGSIPVELGSLSNLAKLYLHFNSLSGSIPVELGNLRNLTNLYLHSNSLSGSIPVELGGLINLTKLHLYSNSLSGSIPIELGNLSNLIELHLGGNSLNGSIPIELGSLSNLTSLVLSNNSLSGSIPVELGSLSNLTHLYLYLNSLSGSIPAELGDLSNLTVFVLHSNSLSGSIPIELGDLSNLIILHLGSNLLSGSIPIELVNLSNLTSLSFGGNLLTDLPDFTGLSLSVGGLQVGWNKIGFGDIITNLPLISNGYTFFYYSQTIEDTVRAVVSHGTTYELGTSEATSGTSYQWYFEETEIDGATAASYSFEFDASSSVGSYTCQMTNSGVSGLMISRAPFLLSNEINIISSTLSEEMDISSEINVYPNPAGDYFTLDSNHFIDGQEINLQLLDLSGGVVFRVKRKYDKFHKILVPSRVSNGIYFLQIQSMKKSFLEKVMIYR